MGVNNLAKSPTVTAAPTKKSIPNTRPNTKSIIRVARIILLTSLFIYFTNIKYEKPLKLIHLGRLYILKYPFFLK